MVLEQEGGVAEAGPRLLEQKGGVAEAGQRLLERVSLYLGVVQEAVFHGMGDRAHQPLCRSKL